MPDALVSAVIISWNSRDTIERCLSSLREAVYKPLEIILVDNASSDGTAEYAEKNFPEAVIIKNSGNMGFSYANNQGIKISRGEFILFLNADAFIRPDFLNILTGKMARVPEIGIAGGKIYKDNEEKIIDSTGIFLPVFKMGPYDRGGGKEDKGRYDRPEFVFGITGACALYRRKCLEDIRLDGRDESLPLLSGGASHRSRKGRDESLVVWRGISSQGKGAGRVL
jgi:GT2 family glycosyltransferase